MELLLKKCPNIRKVDIDLDVLDKSELLSLIGLYCPRVKSLTYYPDYNDENVLLFFQSYGHRLEELNLFGDNEHFEQIFRLCPNLKSVRLTDNFVQFPEDNKFFKAIKKLKIELLNNEFNMNLSVKGFKHCKQLNELDINYPELKEDFFINIASFLPKLKTLRIKSRYQFSKSFIDSFQTMKNIQLISFSVTDGYNKVIYTKYWYFGNSLSEVMLSPNGMNVKLINDNCGLIIHEEYT